MTSNGQTSTATPLPAPTSRTRLPPSGDEEASSTLSLGAFTTTPSLSLSEARILIRAVFDHRRSTGRQTTETDIMVKTQDYLDEFARFKQKENIEAVERLLLGKGELESFERSQIGTLCPESAEEAKTLIPSLANKISDSDLDDLLKEITNLRAFVE